VGAVTPPAGVSPNPTSDDNRVRHRQGPARIRRGVPYSDRDSTLSLLPGALTGEWLAANRDVFHGRLLDVGCGNRPFAAWYGPLVSSAVAVDAAPAERLDALAFADRLPLRDAVFDVVLSTFVIEHVDDPAAAVAEWFRVLRPGGHLVLAAPYLYPTHEAPYDFQRFTHFGLASLLNRAGFQVRRLDAQGGAGLLGAHLGVLAVVQACDAVGRRAVGRPLTDLPAIRALLALPQEAAIAARRRMRRGRPLRGVHGLSTRMSLGYYAIARRPE
jgi:SAM-dependent methyltransferase